MPRSLLLILVLLIASPTAWAQDLSRNGNSTSLNSSMQPANVQTEFLPVDEAYQLALEVLDESSIRVYWQIEDAYYLYQKRFKFSLEDSQGVIELEFDLPAGIEHEDEYFGKTTIYRHAVDIVLHASRSSSDAVLTLGSQGCADAGLCYPPQRQKFRVDLSQQTVAPLLQAGAAQPSKTPPDSATDSDAGSVLLMLLLAFLGGSILNLMPCVFPILSLKVFSFATGTDDAKHHHGWVYSAGVVSSFVLVAAVLISLQQAGAAVGWGFQLQSPHFVALLAYLFFVMGLALSGVIELGSNFMGIGSSLADREGYSGSFFTGVLATVVASPCTAPFMGTALGFAVTQPAAIALLIFAALGAGMAAPMLLLSYSSRLRALMPKPGPWMETFKEILAFPLYATAIWLLWVAGRQTSINAMAGLLVGMLALALGLWLWRRSSTFGRGLGAASILLALAIVASPILDRDASDAATSANAATDSEFSEQRLQQLLNEGQPVFVNVTADWCITCLANERSTLGTDTVLKAMADKSIVYLRADWTNYDPSIADFLARFNRNGIPLYLVYSGRNGEEPEILPQILTPGIVLDAFTDI
jgi:thiol:disulfide interchange protein